MPDQPENSPPKTKQELSRLQQRLTSASLVLLTAFVGIACVVVLSVTLTQTRVSTSAIEGGSVGIRKLDYVGRKWIDLALRIEARADEIVAREGRTDELSSGVTVAEATRATNKKETDALLVGFYFRILSVDGDFAKLIHQKGHDTQVGHISAAKDRIVTAHPELAPIIETIEKSFLNFRDAESKAISAVAEKQANLDAISALKEQIKNAKAALDEQFDLIKPGLDKEARSRVENAFYELSINNFNCGLGNTRCGFVGGAIHRGFYHLLTLRPDLLTLLLVILMGVLGSALQISHAFFMKNEVQSIGGYFQRISVGAMTALVIFIVAKAGVPVLADPARLGGDAPINPYFVSFLAIISGLLSENAIANIQAQGAKLFGPGAAGQERWARNDLTEELTKQGLSVAKLAEILPAPEEVATAMLNGKQKIDAAAQKMIAVYLRREPRDIFTDIAPPPKEKAA
jgi:hypothetical protein